jgi:hypothetical protein
MTMLVTALAADLISDEPAEDRRAALAPFEPLIGTWDLQYTYVRGSGERVEGTGYAHFGWGLHGTAIVDIWAFDSKFVGTTIRYYDAQIDRFRSTWICPARNVTIPFIGRVVDGRIVLLASLNDPPGRRLRWQFVRIEEERFSWTGEVCDDGATWYPVQHIEGTRRL